MLPALLFSQDLQKFLDKISYQESRGSYTVIGGAGGKYIGKYQFSNTVLSEIGFNYITVSKFRANRNIFPPTLQEEAMRLLLKKYEAYLQSEINKYAGTKFNGVLITKAGILAAVHGVGYPQVKLYFKGKSTKSSLVMKYLKQFSEFTIS